MSATSRKLTDCEVVQAIHRGLDLTNKASKKIRDRYHIAKSFINLEGSNAKIK